MFGIKGIYKIMTSSWEDQSGRIASLARLHILLTYQSFPEI